MNISFVIPYMMQFFKMLWKDEVLPSHFEMEKFLLYVFCIGFSSTRGSYVSIITIVIGQNPMYGYYSSGPVFDIAFQTARERYPEMFANITQHTVYKPRNVSGCGDTGDMMFAVAGEVFQLLEGSKGFPIILSPGNCMTLKLKQIPP